MKKTVNYSKPERQMRTLHQLLQVQPPTKMLSHLPIIQPPNLKLNLKRILPQMQNLSSGKLLMRTMNPLSTTKKSQQIDTLLKLNLYAPTTKEEHAGTAYPATAMEGAAKDIPGRAPS